MTCSAKVDGFIQKHWQLREIQGGGITFGREKKGLEIVLFLADRRNMSKQVLCFCASGSSSAQMHVPK